MNKLILAVALVLIAGSVIAQQVTVTRSVSAITGVDQEFSVRLHVQVQSGDPSGIILSEQIPSGWAIIRADSACNINSSKQLIKCVAYGTSISSPLQYTLKSPAIAPAQSSVITGTWQTLTGQGPITGGILQIQKPAMVPDQNANAAPMPPAPVDNNLLYMGIGALAVLAVAGTLIYLHSKPKNQVQSSKTGKETAKK